MSNQYIEIFLYLDPLGKRCNSARKIIKKFREERPENVKIRVVPMVNFKRVYGHTRKRLGEDRTSFVERNNRFSTNTYQACLAFHASAMQGKKKANEFLTVLQEEVVESRVDFSEDLIFALADRINLDMDSFREDYSSELVRRIYRKSLNLAAEMNVTGTPSAVVYKDGVHDEAVRLGEEMEREILHSICGLKEITEIDNGEEIIEEVKEELSNILNLT